MNRRQAITMTLAGGTLSALAAPSKKAANAGVPLQKNDVILFQGDSITDAQRSRETQHIPNQSDTLGRGYPSFIGPQLRAAYPELDLKVYNRGCAGNRVPDLKDRWQKDTIDLKPAIVSILIGVNDIWHTFDGAYSGTLEDYQTGLTNLLESTRRDLPKVRLVVCQPFVLKCGVVKPEWFPAFTQRIQAAREAAAKVDAIWVPFQDAFDKALTDHPTVGPAYWAGDGIHPSLSGHSLMADTWREAVKL